jgi:hypothetical protein
VRYAISLIAIISFGPAATQTGPVLAEDAPVPGTAFRDCPDLCPVMVVLPPGEFMMRLAS